LSNLANLNFSFLCFFVHFYYNAIFFIAWYKDIIHDKKFFNFIAFFRALGAGKLFYFFEWVRELESTALLISEASPVKVLGGDYDEGYLSDGVIALSMQEVREVETQRRIRCVKMRETNHDPSFFSLLFTGGKFQVTKVISE